jgi:hypothetical protein
VALENADAGGGDWIGDDMWQELCEGQVLAVMRILRIEPRQPVPNHSGNEWEPVVVDMLVLSGKYTGTVYRSERMTKAGFTNTLRQKWDPADAAKPAKERRKIPRTEGTDLACRFGFYKDKRSGLNRFALNAAREDDMAEVVKLFAESGDDPYRAAEAKDRELAMAAMGSPGAAAGQPDDLDDEPPF